MINTHLGPSIDIHGGGQDLIFPHHENEIAQGEGANGGQYCRYWLHNGYVTVDGAKMSKSLGNFRTVHNLLRHYPGEVIRYALLAGHYRKPLDFSLAALDQVQAALDRLLWQPAALRRLATRRPGDTCFGHRRSLSPTGLRLLSKRSKNSPAWRAEQDLAPS